MSTPYYNTCKRAAERLQTEELRELSDMADKCEGWLSPEFLELRNAVRDELSTRTINPD